jgi:hypothetical protein
MVETLSQAGSRQREMSLAITSSPCGTRSIGLDFGVKAEPDLRPVGVGTERPLKASAAQPRIQRNEPFGPDGSYFCVSEAGAVVTGDCYRANPSQSRPDDDVARTQI